MERFKIDFVLPTPGQQKAIVWTARPFPFLINSPGTRVYVVRSLKKVNPHTHTFRACSTEDTDFPPHSAETYLSTSCMAPQHLQARNTHTSCDGHVKIMWQSCDSHVTIMWQSCDNLIASSAGKSTQKKVGSVIFKTIPMRGSPSLSLCVHNERFTLTLPLCTHSIDVTCLNFFNYIHGSPG